MHTVKVSDIKPGDGVTAPLRVTLSKWDKSWGTEWVTHLENMQVGGKCYGNYFDDAEAALADFHKRAAKLFRGN